MGVCSDLTEPKLNAGTVVAAAKDQISCDLANEAAVLNLKTGVYFGLDDVGAAVWKLLQTPTTVAAICDALLHEYAVEPVQLQSDVCELLTDMMKEGLVEQLPGEAFLS